MVILKKCSLHHPTHEVIFVQFEHGVLKILHFIKSSYKGIYGLCKLSIALNNYDQSTSYILTICIIFAKFHFFRQICQKRNFGKCFHRFRFLQVRIRHPYLTNVFNLYFQVKFPDHPNIDFENHICNDQIQFWLWHNKYCFIKLQGENG